MNLKEANLFGYPIWYKLYSARSAYLMTALRPQDWDKFIDDMTNKEDVFNLYYKYAFFHYSFLNYIVMKLSLVGILVLYMFLDITGRTVLVVARVMASAVNDWCVMQSLVGRTTDAHCAAT